MTWNYLIGQGLHPNMEGALSSSLWSQFRFSVCTFFILFVFRSLCFSLFLCLSFSPPLSPSISDSFSHFPPFSPLSLIWLVEFSFQSIEMASRILIVGGVAGGATAAARLSRLNRSLQITMLERSPDVSFANCGLPYYIGGEIKERSRLSLQTPESLERALGIRVLTNTEANKIDRATRTVVARGHKGEEVVIPYDRLILSPGASPIVPPGVQVDGKRVFTLRNLQDMDRITEAVTSPSCKRVVVVGAGFIGLEVVEQLVRIQKEVVLVEKSPAVLPQADEEIARMVHTSIALHNVRLLTGNGLSSMSVRTDGVSIQLDSGESLSADAVILAIGVRPDTKFLHGSGIDLTPRGHIPVDAYMRVSSGGERDGSVYAVGDAVETNDFVFPHLRASVALGNLANMQVCEWIVLFLYCIVEKSDVL